MFNKEKGTLDGSIGSWRGHMDIYQKYSCLLLILFLRANTNSSCSRMLREDIQSALIMEDDADWDVMIKSQMEEVARGTRHIQGTHNTSLSPYGDDWWYLATGHCSIKADTTRDQKFWVVDNDPTAVPKNHQTMFFYGPERDPKQLSGKNTRMVFGLKEFVCTSSYALSLQGAARVVFDQELRPNAENVRRLQKLYDEM
jgi:hypothetical protein